MRRITVASYIAEITQAIKNCEVSGNQEWKLIHSATLDYVEKEYLPSGSGIDDGTCIDRDDTDTNKITLLASYHHMNDAGYYDGWTNHIITITPTFRGLAVEVSGEDRNDIHEYLADTYREALSQEVDL